MRFISWPVQKNGKLWGYLHSKIVEKLTWFIMELTDEQRERIRKNRQRALEIKEKKQAAVHEEARKKQEEEFNGNTPQTDDNKTKRKLEDVNVFHDEDERNDTLEDFEIEASEFVTKTEAMKMYCLPEGTLAVCKHVEKENPKHPSWKPMKLYYRSEIRRRARKRYGGLEGLVNERLKRSEKRFRADLEKTKDIFTHSK